MRSDFKIMLAEMQSKHDHENRKREERHSEEIRVRIRMIEETEKTFKSKIQIL